MTHDVLYYQESVMTRSSRRNPDLSCATTNTIDWDLVVSNLAVDLGNRNGGEEEEEEEETTTSTTTTTTTTTTTAEPTEPPTTTTPKPTTKPKPKPATKPKPKPNPRPTPPEPVDESSKCVKDKLSFCQWLIPKCGTSAKTRKDCCKSCGLKHG